MSSASMLLETSTATRMSTPRRWTSCHWNPHRGLRKAVRRRLTPARSRRNFTTCRLRLAPGISRGHRSASAKARSRRSFFRNAYTARRTMAGRIQSRVRYSRFPNFIGAFLS